MRDLTSVQLTCRTWFSDAQRNLYTNVEIVGDDGPSMLSKWKLSRAARLVRLRSTLRSRSLLARLVRTLHVPDPNIPLYKKDGQPSPEYDSYLCTVASVVMACPNLEALTGFYPFYNHTFDRLTHALSTRRKLRQHVWIIVENDDVNLRGQTQLSPGLLDDNQIYQFSLYHSRWKELETLMLCSPGGLGIIEHEIFIMMLHSLPALRNLCISSFDADDFHDTTLLSLPPWVTTLRLEECSGVTEAGLKRWAAKPNAHQVERLSLLHQSITSILTLSKIFASMDRLEKFTIVQNDVLPSLPNGLKHVVVQPVLASKSLQFLHWDLSHPKAGSRHDANLSEGGQASPNMLLALSVTHRGFPRLEKLRAPRDTSPLGILQSVCQPINDITILPGDDDVSNNYQLLRRSSSLKAARLRACRIHDHNVEPANTAPHTDNEKKDLLKVGSLAPPERKSNSETSTATISSIGTENSKTSNYSTHTISTSRTMQELVSPISPNQDPFSPFAPDDGVVSPIAADPDRVNLSGGDSDKQAITGPVRRSRHGKERAEEESVCRCTPNPTMNRDSAYFCDIHNGSNAAQVAITIVPPPRSPFRPTSSEIADQPRTRFPSLIRTKQKSVPIFCLEPDVVGHDGNGGLVGWGQLMKIGEKAKANVNAQKPAENVEQKPKSSIDQENDDNAPGPRRKIVGKLCTGPESSNRHSEDQLGELPALQRILSTSTTTSTASSTTTRSNSTSKSTSLLSLALGLKSSEKVTVTSNLSPVHVARPRGVRGGDIVVDDFF